MRLRKHANFLIEVSEIMLSVGLIIIAGLFVGGVITVSIILISFLFLGII